VAGAVTRFSRVASTSVALLVVTGVYQAWRGIGSLAALSGSAYGSLLVFKLAVVGVLLWLGWMSRSLVLRRFVLPTVNGAAAAPAAAGSTGGRAAVATMNRTGRRAERAHEQQNLQARNQLGWSVRAEAAIGVVVIAITAMLVATPPATRSDGAGAVAPAPQPFSTQLALDGGAWVEVRMDPGRMGANSLTLAIRRADASAWDVPEVRAALYLPEQDLGPLPVTLDQVGPGDYAAPEVNIPAPGTWRLEVKVRTSEIDQTTVATEIPAL
jgi:copper transport protein